MNSAFGPFPSAPGAAGYELRFRSLFQEGRGLSFPCDAHGRVELDALSERARTNYLYARAVVGREYATPSVQLRDLH
jgi:hypothetical protein